MQDFPNYQVRPVVPSEAIPHLVGRTGFEPAATLTLGKKQSRLDWRRNMDNALRRMEDWEKKHCSAEPVLLGSFPTFGQLATKSFLLVGALPPGQEARELQIVVTGTLAKNATTGVIKAADHNILAVALFKKIRASLYGNNDAYNLTAPENRTMAYIADARDQFQKDPALRIGATFNTTPVAFQLTFKIPFCVRSLEVPEIFSPTSDQINLPGSKLDLDTQGDALTAIAMTDGTSTVVVNDVRLYAILNQIPVLHAGPPHVWRTRAIAQTVDTEYGQGCHIFMGTEEAATAAGAGARVSQFTVRRDGRSQPLNLDPVSLAQMFNESHYSPDPLAALDITTGFLPFGGVATAAAPIPANASIGSQAGAAVVPLIWNDGRVHAGAWQWPFWLASVAVQQNLVAGQSAAITLFYWQVRPIYECAGQVVALSAANGIPISSIDDLKVRGGYDGEVNKLFKGRFIQKKVTPARAA
jgi:hypothetical protein